MTRADLDELERLLAAWQSARNTRPVKPSTLCRMRKDLQTALVRHANDLIAAAKAQRFD